MTMWKTFNLWSPTPLDCMLNGPYANRTIEQSTSCKSHLFGELESNGSCGAEEKGEKSECSVCMDKEMSI